MLAVDRVRSPTIERLRGRAIAVTTRAPADDAQQALSRLAASIRSTIKHLHVLSDSGPSAARMAQAEAEKARAALDELVASQLVAADLLAPADRAVRLVEDVAAHWLKAVDGVPRDAAQDDGLLAEAEETYVDFVGSAKREVALMRERERAGDPSGPADDAPPQ